MLRMHFILILVACGFFRQAAAQTYVQEQKIVSLDRASGDMFGFSVAVSGNYAIVGAQNESEDTLGMNTLAASGAAYIFEKNASGVWVQKQKLVPADRTLNDYFGASVSIDGTRAIVGAYEKDSIGGANLPHAGAVFIYERNSSGHWTQVRKLVASDPGTGDHFGFSISLSGDYILVGAPIESEDVAGGNTLNSSGSAYIFERDMSGHWPLKQKLVASDRAAVDLFGSAVAVSGDYAMIGAYREDEDPAGGNTISDAGSVYFFKRDGTGTWNQTQKVVASDRANTDRFGIAVAMDSAYAVIGAYLEDEDENGLNTMTGAGSAYVFERNAGGVWNEVQKIVATDRGANDNFGIAVSLEGNEILVGAPYEDQDADGLNTLTNSGSAYVFKRDTGGNWTQTQKVVSDDRANSDLLGNAVCINHSEIIAGAYLEDEDASGSNSLSGAGSAYFFNLCYATFSSMNVSVCSNYISPSGNYNWTASGTYYDTLQSMKGCDSVITVNLVVKNSAGSVSPVVCDVYISPSGMYTWSASGTYSDTLGNTAGCDSIITINLTVQQTTSYPVITACGSYVSPSGNYTWTTSGNYQDTIPNAAGCDSIMSINLSLLQTYAQITDTACRFYISPDGLETWTVTGTYTDTLINVSGCDSIITLMLTIQSLDTSVSVSGFTLTANATGVGYQWLDCQNGNAPLTGETNAVLNPQANGYYAVQVSESGCADTSSCYLVNGIGTAEINAASGCRIYPNPADHWVNVQLSPAFFPACVSLKDITGKEILVVYKLTENKLVLPVSMLDPGIYLITISGNGLLDSGRFIKW